MLERLVIFCQRQYFILTALRRFLQYHLTTKKRGIYVGCTDMNNLGDETVFENIRVLFQEDVYLYKMSYRYRDLSLSIMRKFKKSPDLILLGGGTLISRGPNEGYLKLFLQVIDIFKNARLFVFGAGVSEVQLAEQAKIPTDVVAWAKVLDRCEGIAVRGHISKGFLADWNVKTDVTISGDPAILHARDVIVKKNRQRKIGVNFCNILDRIHGLDGSAVIAFGTKMFEILIRDKWDIYLFPMTDTDFQFMRDTMLKENIDKVKSFQLTDDADGALDFLESMDIFLGERLHSIVFATAVYTPLFAIEYHSKTMDYLDMMGLHKHSMRTDSLDVEAAYKRLLEIYDNIESEQQLLFDNMQVKKKKLIDESKRFRALIKK